MSDNDLKSPESSGVECPECGDTFGNTHGMKTHYARTHGGSIAGQEAECANCSKKIRRHKSRMYDRVFCDMSCKSEWQSEHLNGEGNPAYRDYTKKAECSYCGDDIVRSSESHRSDTEHSFCDMECYGNWRSENVVGESHPQYEEGFTDNYGPSWPKQREKALERDNRSCRVCGMENPEHREKFGCGVHVHHIRPFREFGLPNHQEANALSNLVVLCQDHHTQWEGIPIAPQ